MRLQEWYDEEIRVKKMCVECEEILHFHTQKCTKCLCSEFFYLTRLLRPAFISRISKEKDGLRKDPLLETKSKKLGAALFEMTDNKFGDF